MRSEERRAREERVPVLQISFPLHFLPSSFVPPFALPPSSFRLPPSPFLIHPSSFILHPLSFIIHPSFITIHLSSLILHRPSSFLLPHSSFLSPPSSFLLPLSSFLPPQGRLRQGCRWCQYVVGNVVLLISQALLSGTHSSSSPMSARLHHCRRTALWRNLGHAAVSCPPRLVCPPIARDTVVLRSLSHCSHCSLPSHFSSTEPPSDYKHSLGGSLGRTVHNDDLVAILKVTEITHSPSHLP